MRMCRLVGSAVRRVGEAISGRLSAAYPGAERRFCSPPRSRVSCACALLWSCCAACPCSPVAGGARVG